MPLGEKLEPKSPVRIAKEDDGNSDDAVGAVEAGEREEEEDKTTQPEATSRTRLLLREERLRR